MDQNPPKESRPPINLRIKFRSESLEQFIERYAVDVSRGGIFIRTRDPLAVGTHLKLDFQFQNGNALMSGDGTVVWIRELDPNRTSVPPGMGVRFDKLTPESQTVLEQLLIEKAKRERSGVPGSTPQGAGGMAVRRPSSMFSVLEPQSPGGQPAAGGKAAAPAPSGAEASKVDAGKVDSGKVAAGKPDAHGAYRPLGTARNPFSSVPSPGASSGDAGAGGPASGPSASGLKPLAGLSSLAGSAAARATSSGSTAGTQPGASAPQRPTSADDAAPIDDFNDEPTQIAGRLPSFLTSDDDDADAAEEPTVAAKSLSESVAAALRSPSAKPDIQPTAQHTKKSGTDKAEPSKGKASLDQGLPGVGGTATTAIPARDTGKAADVKSAGAKPADGTLADSKAGDSKPSDGKPSDGKPSDSKPSDSKPSDSKPSDSKPATAGDVVAPARVGNDLERAMAPTPIAIPRPSSGMAVGATAVAGDPKAPAAAPAIAAQAQPAAAKRTMPAVAIAGSILALGAATFFLIRFFGSQHSEQITASSPTAPSAASLRSATESIAVNDNPPSPPTPPTGGEGEPAAAPPAVAGAADPATPPAAAVVPIAPAGPTAGAPDKNAPVVKKADDATAKAGKRSKVTRSSTAKENGALAGGGEASAPKAAEAAAASAAGDTAAATTAKGESAAGTTGETEPTAHQVRITSKPAGADVMLDGVAVGNTPFSIGIADITAAHSIAVRKDGFEPFEQMISASSAWSKTKGAKGKPALEVLKLNARLKEIGGAAEPRPTTEPPSAEGGGAAKSEGAKVERPLPPTTDDRGPTEPPPP